MRGPSSADCEKSQVRAVAATTAETIITGREGVVGMSRENQPQTTGGDDEPPGDREKAVPEALVRAGAGLRNHGARVREDQPVERPVQDEQEEFLKASP